MKIGQKLVGSISINDSGNGFFTSEEADKTLFVYKTNAGKSLHLDTVRVEIIKGKRDRFEAKVIEVVERFKTTFVGILDVGPDFALLDADNKKIHVDFYVNLADLNGAKDGQKVVIELLEWKEEHKTPNAKVISVLGEAGDNDTEIHSILAEYDLPYEFPQSVLDEADRIDFSISDEEVSKRKDMRDVLTFTIDPDTAKDFDDALSVQWVDGNLEVGVHIADVSHYMRPDTELDKEAIKRATSVYLVDRCVPMLPEHLSNGVCSLRPHEDKLCFSAIFTLDKDGVILSEWFGRTVIHSNHRFTYDEAQVIIDNKGKVDDELFLTPENAAASMDDPNINKHLAKAVLDLDRYAKKIRARRNKNGVINFDKPEVKFVLDSAKKPVDIMFRTLKDANKLIEDFMLMANEQVAKFITEKKLPFVYRIHDEPNPDKLLQLKDFIKQFGYDIAVNNPKEIKATLNKLLIDSKGTPEENMIENLAVRTMQKAVYTTQNVGHYGLGFDDYTHFTSPIRRYPDVMVHRLLHHYLEGKSNIKQSKLQARCEHASNCERKAQKASRESIKYKQAEYMESKIGSVYNAVVSSVQEYGVFVEIPENGCDCLCRISDISGYWKADTSNHRLVNKETGEQIRLGDEVTVIIKSADVERKTINVSIMY